MAILGVTATAHADPEALFKEGRELVEADDWKNGCAKFEAAYEESQKPSIEANLAMCAEHFDELPKAWRLYLSAAEKWGAEEGAISLRDKAAGVAKRATVVVIRVPDPALDGLRITLAGREVEPASEIRELVIPGDIKVSAKATGREPWRQTVTGRPGETVAVEVVLETQRESATTTTHRRRSRVYLSIGLGAVSVAAFATSYFLAKSASDQYDDIRGNTMYCMPQGCTDEGISLIDDTQRKADIATGVAIAGAAFAAGALVVFFTAPRDTVLTPVVTSQTAGLSLTARF
ncbi:MAG: hypothetical protein M4D80_35900 [Myxococcota bacterium]|nr:hypothetical protein [Myxococcota bacterium]